MLKMLSKWTLGLFVLLSFALTTAPQTSNVLEHLPHVPEGWSQGGLPPASTVLHFRLAVLQPRAAEFEQHVLDISTPAHPKYGLHMRKDEVKEFLRPAQAVSEAILEWLQSYGVKVIMSDGDWVSFTAMVEQAERMMDTRFHYYFNGNTRRIRTLQYSVPSGLDIQMIQPTTRFVQIRPEKRFISSIKQADNLGHNLSHYNATFCNTTVTPACLRGLYGLGNFTAKRSSGLHLGISGYLDQYAQYADLDSFIDTYASYASSESLSIASINGGLNTQGNFTASSSTSEANVDVQYGLSLSYDNPTIFYTTTGRGPLIPNLDQPDPSVNSNEPYLDQLHYLLSLPDDQLPSVLSTSYGEAEQEIPASYANATCSLFAQLGARGVSVIFSSGDNGVGFACQTNDGTNTTRFTPMFPAACPFVTSVGGTYHVEPERAADISSGGFSDVFPRPSYQDEAVGAYLDRLGDTWAGLFNPNGRGFPDVAAQSNNFSVFDQGNVTLIGGTSCAAPTFAAIIMNLNNVRVSAGKRPLGFLNPWIYSTAKNGGLTDIVDGRSIGCLGEDLNSEISAPFVPYASWNATPGWDPVTGFGTPFFPKLVELADC